MTIVRSWNPDALRGFVGPTVVKKDHGENWVTVEPLEYVATRQRFVVPPGSATDLASVPRVLAWLVPRAGDSVSAAILHDYLWDTEAPAGRITYREADGILRQALRVSGVSFVLRWLCWVAVRWAALLRPDGYRGWWRDAPLVLLWTAAALPVIALPVLTAAIALLVVQLAEMVSWLVLRAFSRKRVNPPNVTTHT